MKFSIERIHEIASKISQKKWGLLKQRSPIREFNAYPNVLCVFQTFNKSHLIRLVLNPFIKKGFKNIMLFADGCIDSTLTKAHSILKGKNHTVIAVNDLHEIKNYRFALNSEAAKNCEFALLMQDDDLYPMDFSWLDYGLEMMRRDPKLIVIGFNKAINYIQMRSANETFESDTFAMRDGLVGMPNSWFGRIVTTPINDGPFQYCQTVTRAPHLIRISSFNELTGFDFSFEPYHDDDTNYCFELWAKGFRVGYIGGVPIARDIGVGGMRLSESLMINKRPIHLKRNHNILFERYGDFINSGALDELVEDANERLLEDSPSGK
ncbi:glycosyltransferase family 2 protein [Polynucleobacter sp. MWH-UH2A]|uniref:glycosyltransferase family 2 protein n=1 Tax=Polynucleobacter sp. MWH-UH2A TaxID=1855617 RepID=UPI001BFD6404|nr:hypothetical protein [Polynucleobacter sp. MWH-UH2A]QWD64184.1 hypothetical protein IC571_00685 [Polynucleobacter sp. MWH-UH2A]